MIIARPGRQLTVKFDQIMFAISPWADMQLKDLEILFKSDALIQMTITEKNLSQGFIVNLSAKD